MKNEGFYTKNGREYFFDPLTMSEPEDISNCRREVSMVDGKTFMKNARMFFEGSTRPKLKCFSEEELEVKEDKTDEDKKSN